MPHGCKESETITNWHAAYALRTPIRAFRAIPESCLSHLNRGNLYFLNSRYTAHWFDFNISHRNVSMTIDNNSITKESNQRSGKFMQSMNFPRENCTLVKWRRGPSRRAVVISSISIQRFWAISCTKILKCLSEVKSASQMWRAEGLSNQPRICRSIFRHPSLDSTSSVPKIPHQ